MSEFVSHKCKQAWFNLYNIRQIRSFIDNDTCKILVHALVISHLDYANALLYGIKKKDLRKLQTVQNSAAKLILRRGKYDSASQAMKELHWLPVEQRIKHKILSYVHKCLAGDAPVYLQNLLTRWSNEHFTRSTTAHTLAVPRYNGIGLKSFSHAGPTLWNALPKELRDMPNYNSFKKCLKTHLFREAYNLSLS